MRRGKGKRDGVRDGRGVQTIKGRFTKRDITRQREKRGMWKRSSRRDAFKIQNALEMGKQRSTMKQWTAEGES